MHLRFLHPSMLALAAAVMMAPVVLHLLSRWRYRTVAWGAMMFLRDAQAPRKHAGRFKQWALLALRMLLIALLGLALARPVIGSNRTNAGDQPLTAVLILDRSASMSIDENGRSRLSLARDAAQQIVQNLIDRHAHDRLALITMGDPVPQAPLPPTADLPDIQRRLPEVTIASGVADVVAALRQAQSLLQQTAGPRAVYLISDRQARSWDSVNDTFLADWSHPAAVHWIEIGSDQASNVALEDLTLTNPPAVADMPMEATVRLRNYGSVARNGVQVQLYTTDEHGNRRAASNTAVNLAAGAQATLHLSFNPGDSGCRLLSADVRSGGLTTDKHQDCAFDVLDPLRVLIVRDESPPKPDVIRLALSPFSNPHAGARNLATVQTLATADWDLSALPQQDVLILSGLHHLTEPQARAMEQFVYDGGGLVIAPDETMRLEDYNALLWRDGQGLLPAAFEEPHAPTPAEDFIASADVGSPVFAFLQGRAAALSGIAVRHYLPVDVPEDAAGRILARLGSGAPLLLDRDAGHGAVFQFTTTLSADWNDLPLSADYLPLLQSIVRDAARGRVTTRNLRPGQPISQTFAQTPDPRTLRLQLPSGEFADPAALEWVKQNDQWSLRYLQTQQPGVYRLRYSPAATQPSQVRPAETRAFFVVRGSHPESDITPLSADRREQLQRQIGLVPLARDTTALQTATTPPPAGREMWFELVLAVLWLAGVELLVARLMSLNRGKHEA